MIKQKNDKDCLQCCLSEILEINYEDIPEFYRAYMESSDKGNKLFDSWLKRRGLQRFFMEFTKGHPFPYCSGSAKFLGELKKDNRKHSHAVVLWEEDGEVYMEDPKINSDYTIDDLQGVEIYFPIKTIKEIL